MPPNLPRSHTAPRLTLRPQSRKRNIHKSGLDQKHANYTNYAWLCYPSHAYIHNTNISHIHSSSPPNADCKFLLVVVGGIGSTCSFLQRSCFTLASMSTKDSTNLSHSPKVQCHSLFCGIPTIFPWDFEVMSEVDQYLPIIILGNHVDGVFPIALPQSPHAATVFSSLSVATLMPYSYHSCFIVSDVDQSESSVVRSILRSWEIPSPLWQTYLSIPGRRGKHVWNVKGHARNVRRHGKHVWNASAWMGSQSLLMRNICGMFQENLPTW